MLTDNLRLELQTTVAVVNRWAEKQCDALDFHKLTFDKAVDEFECTVSALNDTNDELESMRPQQSNIKNAQIAEINTVLNDVKSIAENNIKLDSQLSNLQTQEAALRQTLLEKTKEFDELKTEAAKAANDRKFGLSKFTNGLCLRFEKAKSDSIKFIFHNIIPNNPSFECYFIIRVDDNDIYQLMECYPNITSTHYDNMQMDIHYLLTQLNTDNDIAKYTVLMRKLFIQNVC